MRSPVSTIFGGFAKTALNALAAWMLSGVAAALREVAGVIGSVTSPNLGSVWFTSNYWRMTEIASMLTVPFLFAAAIQAIVRTDLALLVRATFMYLPLALIGVSLAAPIVTLLLAATDELSAFVGGAGIGNGSRFLLKAAAGTTTAAGATGSPALLLMLGVFTIIAAITLTLELLVREAAVYIVVLMLPLAFAAMVWPARRIWTVRMLELLLALILSKFVIVSILALAGDAFGSTLLGVSQQLAAAALLLMACFAPWAILKLLPFTELNAHATDAFRQQAHKAIGEPLSEAAHGMKARSGQLTAEMASRAAADGQGFASSGDDGGWPGPTNAGAPLGTNRDPSSRSGGDGAIASGVGADTSTASGGASAADAALWFNEMIQAGAPSGSPAGGGGWPRPTDQPGSAEGEPWTPTVDFDDGTDLGSAWASDSRPGAGAGQTGDARENPAGNADGTAGNDGTP